MSSPELNPAEPTRSPRTLPISLALQQLLPYTANLTTLNPDTIREGQELATCLRSERDEARLERNEHMTGEGHLQQRLADAERTMNRLAAAPAAAPAAAAAHSGCASGCSHTRDRAEWIADPDKFDGTREVERI